MSARDPDEVLVGIDGPEVEHVVSGSRFVGRTYAVGDPESAARRLAVVRRIFHDATHHAWAYRFGPPEEPRTRFDDDGEPSGTAGRPILRAIEGAGVHDVLAVVTRWFGGVKLGTGGLARAYGEAAVLALAAAPPSVAVRTVALAVACAFEDLGAVEAVIARAGADVVGVARAFEPQPRFTVHVRRSRTATVRAALVEATAGRASLGAS